MNRESSDLLAPRILVVDDERQIHASLRLRLGNDYELTFCFSGREALERVARERFDLCFADIHMPEMDGLAFVESAQRLDPCLGYVFLSAFDTDENLRRAIPLRVYDFLGKPLPDRDGFEARIPEWIERTRSARHQQALAQGAASVVHDLNSARLEREVELVASESARDALLQTAGLLTTIHAHLLSSSAVVAARAKTDPSLGHLLRSLEEARKTADAAVLVAEGFFDSAYGNRDTAPAAINAGIRHAISIASRMNETEAGSPAVDFAGLPDDVLARGISGIEFLLMMVPVLGVALASTQPAATVRVACEQVARLEAVTKDTHHRAYLWINRRNALVSQPGIAITVTAPTAAPAPRTAAEAWLRGGASAWSSISARGLVLGVQKSKGLLGIALPPECDTLEFVVGVPIRP